VNEFEYGDFEPQEEALSDLFSLKVKGKRKGGCRMASAAAA